MSPLLLTWLSLLMSFPRVSGDEPCYQRHNLILLTFSPRERG